MELKQIAIEQIKPNPFQPRMKFDKDELQELADNIGKHGMIEPIVVTAKAGKYMIVAGERRWRANKIAKKDKMYAIVKDYPTDVDVKRDSLVENEMRENLNDNEFESFVYSLAKSLGQPYYNKGWIDKLAITKYILGDTKSSAGDSSFFRRIDRIIRVKQQASPKVKKLLEDGKIGLGTAQEISTIKDKQIQDEIADMAKNKNIREVQQEVAKHNLSEKAEEIKSQPKGQDVVTESKFLTKYFNKVEGGVSNVKMLADMLKTVNSKAFASRLAHSSRLDIMDALKPLRTEVDRLKHIVDKTMELMSE